MRISISCSFALLSGCAPHVPPLDSCLFDQPRQKFHCDSKKTGSYELLPMDKKADKLLCLPYEDGLALAFYCESLKH